MELCQRYNLRFLVIADRFVSYLKEKYDNRQIKKMDLEPHMKKRDLKSLEKEIKINQLDPVAFDRTVDEIKYRYYEVARAVLKFRGHHEHRYLKHDPFDIELETQCKNNWERVCGRVKESFTKEKSILQERHKIEAQIRKVERDEMSKLKVVSKLTGASCPDNFP